MTGRLDGHVSRFALPVAWSYGLRCGDGERGAVASAPRRLRNFQSLAVAGSPADGNLHPSGGCFFFQSKTSHSSQAA